MTTMTLIAPLRLNVALIQGGIRGESRCVSAQWKDEATASGRLGRAEASVSVDEASLIVPVSVGLIASWGSMQSLGGFAVLKSAGVDQVCWSFLCLPGRAQSMTIQLDREHALEVMVVSDVPKNQETV
jgi:hypothetical protein